MISFWNNYKKNDAKKILEYLFLLFSKKKHIRPLLFQTLFKLSFKNFFTMYAERQGRKSYVAKKKKEAWNKRGEKGKKLRLKREGNPKQPWKNSDRTKKKWQRKWQGKHKVTPVEEDNYYQEYDDDFDDWEVFEGLFDWVDGLKPYWEIDKNGTWLFHPEGF